jgi:hypothetical protein
MTSALMAKLASAITLVVESEMACSGKQILMKDLVSDLGNKEPAILRIV